jgi:hypothetical protein
MRFKFVSTAAVAALSISLLGATGASAAVEAGNRCAANASKPGVVLVSTGNAPGNPLPATIPSSGVITRWSFSVGLPIPPGAGLSEILKVFRPTGIPGQFQVVGESVPQVVGNGTQTFPTRIPVRAGDLIGALGASGGSSGAVYCITSDPGDRVASTPGTAPLNSTVTSTGEETGIQQPIVVSIEPDADNDGFGDETQDQCPQSVALQTACPPVALSTTKQIRKGSVTIVVTSSTTAPVTVIGVANLGKGKKVKLNGGTQNLAPGVLGKFTLRFTKGLKAKLKELPPKRSVRLNVTVSGTSISGAVTTSALKLKLRGQAKP